MCSSKQQSSSAAVVAPRPKGAMWWEHFNTADWNAAFEKYVASGVSTKKQPASSSETSNGSMSDSSSCSSVGSSRAFINKITNGDCKQPEEGKLKVSSGARQNHWFLYEILWNYCGITRAFVAMKNNMSKKEQRNLNKIINKANGFNLELAVEAIFLRAKKTGKRGAGNSLSRWDIDFLLKCFGKSQAHALKIFNQCCVDVVLLLEDSEKVVQILDLLIERAECGGPLRNKLQMVLSVFLNYNESEKIVRRDFIGSAVRHNQRAHENMIRTVQRKKCAVERSTSSSTSSTSSSSSTNCVVVNPSTGYVIVDEENKVVKRTVREGC